MGLFWCPIYDVKMRLSIQISFFPKPIEKTHKTIYILQILPITHKDAQQAHYIFNIKQSHYRPGQALRVPVGWGSQISRQSAHEGSKVVSPTNRPPLPSGNIPGTHFCRDWVDPRATVRPEGLCKWKIPVTPSGIEPAIFRLVALCLNQLSYSVPHLIPWTFIEICSENTYST